MARLDKARLLIIASSARALAAAAVHAGYRPDVMDTFVDADTREYAVECHVVQGDGRGLSPVDLMECLIRYRARYGDATILPGAGFEPRPELLARLADFGEVLGNDAKTLARLKDPIGFSAALARLGLPAPRISTTPPVTSDRWLLKPRGSCGGVGIRRWSQGDDLPSGCYLQALAAGRPASVLFLCDGRRHRIIGHNLCGTVSDTDWRFAEAVRWQPPALLADRLETAVALLVTELGLRGLCGMDVMVNGGDFQVLEINARPPASFELHDGSPGLLPAHIAACRGKLTATPRRGGWPGKRVVYAVRDCMIQAGFEWPAWSADRPPLPAVIPAGAPICTVFADAASPALTSEQLRQRALALLEAFRAPGGIRPHDDKTMTTKEEWYEQINPRNELELAQRQ